jgi:hypothetical protein
MEDAPRDQGWLEVESVGTSSIFKNPVFYRRLHAVLTGVWLLAIIPSVTLWRESITWIVFMSVWANVAGHFSSWQAARVEVNQEQENKS